MSARDRLAAIGARAGEATAGPWSVRLDGREIYGPDGWWIGQFQRKSDSALALAARTDMPALVAFATAVLDLADADDPTPELWSSAMECLRDLVDEHLGGGS